MSVRPYSVFVLDKITVMVCLLGKNCIVSVFVTAAIANTLTNTPRSLIRRGVIMYCVPCVLNYLYKYRI